MLGLSELYTEDFTEQMTARTQADKGTGIPVRWMEEKREVEGGALDARNHRVGSRVVLSADGDGNFIRLDNASEMRPVPFHVARAPLG